MAVEYCCAVTEVSRTVEKNEGAWDVQVLPWAQIRSNGTSGQFAFVVAFSGVHVPDTHRGPVLKLTRSGGVPYALGSVNP